MTPRNWAFDAVVALAVATAGVLEAIWGINATHQQGPAWAEAAVYVATGLLLLIRRVTPIGCLVAILGVSTVEFAVFGSPEGNGVMLPGLIAAYTIGRRVDRHRSWWGLVLVALLWAVWSGFDPVRPTLPNWWLDLFWLTPWVIGWLAGALVRTSRQVVEQRRSAAQQRASRAVAEERNRIARELHDVIGHSVSVMTVQAGAVRRRLLPEQGAEREALESVETVGRQALGEMRRMVGVLRTGDESGDRQPAPGLDRLPALVEEFRSTGLPVHLTRTGDETQLAPGLDLTAYRLLQEGLTNVLHHAVSPRDVVVSVDRAEGALTLAVRDDGLPASSTEVGGHGLLGMRERVAVYGGTLRSGPRPSGGFELVAVLPVDDLAPTPGVVPDGPTTAGGQAGTPRGRAAPGDAVRPAPVVPHRAEAGTEPDSVRDAASGLAAR